jgi:hypothetical protein
VIWKSQISLCCCFVCLHILSINVVFQAVESLLEQWLAIRGLGEEIWENQRVHKGVFAAKHLSSNERAPYSSREGKTIPFT